MSTFASSTFTGAAGTALADYSAVGESTWSLHPIFGDPQPVLTDAGRVRPNRAGFFGIYLASGLPSGPEYDIPANIYFAGTTTGLVGLVGRVDPANETFYLAYLNASSGLWTLYKAVMGTYTSLGTYSQSLTPDTTYVVTFRIRDDAKTLLVDGTDVITSSDNAIADAGRVGAWFEGGSSDSTGLHLDDYAASDAMAAGPGMATVRVGLARSGAGVRVSLARSGG